MLYRGASGGELASWIQTLNMDQRRCLCQEIRAVGVASSMGQLNHIAVSGRRYDRDFFLACLQSDLNRLLPGRPKKQPPFDRNAYRLTKPQLELDFPRAVA